MRRAAPLAVLALALAGCGAGEPRAAVPERPGDTRVQTLVDPDRDGALEPGPPARPRARHDLGGSTRAGRVLATVGQLTDTHVRDEESPARAAFLDRLGRPFDSVFRPHEALLPHVLAAGTRALNAQRADAVVVTGDIVDNAQANELDQAVALLRGGTVRPDSGARGYDGVQEATNPDPAFYRPDVDPPRHPGLLDRAQRAFRAPGLDAPWFPLVGNHDVLVGGEIAGTAATNALATGPTAVVAPPAGLEVPRDDAGVDPELLDRLLADGIPGETRTVPRDRSRREPPAAEVVRRLRAASGAPGAGERLQYAVDLGPRVRGIVLDTVRRDAGSGGVADARTAAFLRAELAAAGGRWVLLFTHEPLERTVGAAPLLALLDAHPTMLAAFSGSTHRAKIRPRRAANGGWWLVSTPALADFPMQARVARVREAVGGGAVLETWLVDAAPDPLADIARELAFLDAQGGRPRGLAGRAADRNAVLARPAPR